MQHNEMKKILVIPIVLTVFIAALIILFESGMDGSIPKSERQLAVALLLMLMASLYFFTISFVVPLYYALRKWCRTSWLALLLFNVIGFTFIAAIDYWLITIFDVKSIYFIYPLFSALMLLQFNDKHAPNKA